MGVFMNFRKLITYLTMGTAAAMPIATAQNPTILQGSYVSNVFGPSNFVKNPNAQTNVANVTVSSATVTRSTTTPLVATSEFNITTSTSTGYADWSTRTFDAGMKNNNCEARFSYRGFTVGTTKAQLIQNSLVVAELTLVGDANNPKIASINFPCGDLTYATTFRLQQSSASLTGTNEIGGLYVGLATNQANVAQAEIVVQAARNSTQTVTSGTTATILWNNEISDTFGEYDPATGLFTAKRAGIYEVNATAMINALSIPTNARVDFIIWKNSQTIDNQLEQQQVTSTRFWKLRNSATMTLAVGDVVKVTVSSSSLGTYDIYNDVFSEYNKISIKRFPSSSELVVTPERQNVWGAVKYAGNTDYVQTAAASDLIVNTTAFSTPSFYGGASASSSACGLTTNDIGMCLQNVPPGTYQISTNLEFGSRYADGTPGFAICSSHVAVTGSSLATTKTASAVAYTTVANNEDWSQLGTGIVKIDSLQSYLSIVVKVSKSTSAGGCRIRSASSGSTVNSHPTITLKPLDQPSNSALYVQGPVKAAETGATISAGYLGQEIRSVVTSFTNFPTSGQYGDATSVSLTPGVWDISATIHQTGGAGVSSILFGISTTSGNSGSGLVFGDNLLAIPLPASGDSAIAIPQFRALVTSTTTYYAKVRSVYTTTAPQYQMRISAVRIN